MYLVDLPDGTNVHWDPRRESFSIRDAAGKEIGCFTHRVTRSYTKSPSVSQARRVALRYLRNNERELKIVVPRP